MIYTAEIEVGEGKHCGSCSALHIDWTVADCDDCCCFAFNDEFLERDERGMVLRCKRCLNAEDGELTNLDEDYR